MEVFFFVQTKCLFSSIEDTTQKDYFDKVAGLNLFLN